MNCKKCHKTAFKSFDEEFHICMNCGTLIEIETIKPEVYPVKIPKEKEPPMAIKKPCIIAGCPKKQSVGKYCITHSVENGMVEEVERQRGRKRDVHELNINSMINNEIAQFRARIIKNLKEKDSLEQLQYATVVIEFLRNFGQEGV